MINHLLKCRYTLIFFALLFSLGSCVNLKSVGDFSATSMESISNYERIDYSFLQHCLDRCEDEAIRKYEIKRAQECSCALYQEADSVTQVIYNTIEGYFVGLADLSHNELTTYSTDAVVGALSVDEFGPLKIDDQLVGAFTSLSNTLLRATTDFYRRKKLSSYIEEANDPIKILLEKFRVIVGTNLKGELRFKRERLYSYYIEMKLNGTLHSDYEKGKATSDYYKALNAIQRKEMELEIFAESLDEIAQGHQILYDNREKLSVKDLQALLQSYSSNVKGLISEFNKLND